MCALRATFLCVHCNVQQDDTFSKTGGSILTLDCFMEAAPEDYREFFVWIELVRSANSGVPMNASHRFHIYSVGDYGYFVIV